MRITLFCNSIQIHRRLIRDDFFGVGEVLNETAFGKGLIVRGKHYLVLNGKTASEQTREIAEARERSIQLRTLLPSSLFFSNVSQMTYDTWRDKYNNNVSFVQISFDTFRFIHFSLNFISQNVFFVYSTQRCPFRFPKTFICLRLSHGKMILL